MTPQKEGARKTYRPRHVIRR